MRKNYTASMIVIGNEILSGRTHDQNINYVANKLGEAGVRLVEVRIIPDIEEKIIAAIYDLKNEVDYIFTSGGIGPTHDDITSASVARAVDLELVYNEEARDLLLAHYGEEGLSDARLKMAQTPIGASLIPNPVSAAPGFIIENIFVMAGVPAIMRAMMDYVVLSLKGGAVIQSKTVICSCLESVIAKDLGQIQDQFPDIDIGSYPHFKNGDLGVSIVLRGIDMDGLNIAADQVLDMVNRLSV